MIASRYRHRGKCFGKKDILKQILLLTTLMLFLCSANCQTPRSYTSSEILAQLKKLNVLGSVLYVAAHPDDENTRLLAYLANEKMYRTGYLSLTRGDGGQNLIGDEQGIDLGLIRTQELLSARRIDGAEQFFSTAYDFGFSKSPEEALRIWGHDKILSDVVWVIRKFRPDVIITRFPTTGEGGHGHHTASAILAGEAFDAAADPTKFPEQLKSGVEVWQAKRLLWNTFNFGGTNTQNDSQLKMDVGMFNPLLGKSYGEIAALSRSQHKSQGFGVPAQRGASIEYFKTIKGEAPTADLMDGINTGWDRLLHGGELINRPSKENNIQNFIADSIIKNFDHEHPEISLPQLIRLYSRVSLIGQNYQIRQKLAEINNLIEICSGVYLEATASNQLNTIGDSIKITLTINNRLGAGIEKAFVSVFGNNTNFASLEKNTNKIQTISMILPAGTNATQPYWLERQKETGRFRVDDQKLIGNPQNPPYTALFELKINGQIFDFNKPVFYKYTDPVKGELYEPIQLVNPAFINTSPSLIIFNNTDKHVRKTLQYTVQSNITVPGNATLSNMPGNKKMVVIDSSLSLHKTEKRKVEFIINSDSIAENSAQDIGGELSSPSFFENQYFSLKKISYDHIPDIIYNYYDATKVIKLDLQVSGSTVGYIPGAGDRVAEALEQMGYKVTILKEADITTENLKQFDAVITGVRAYNTNGWMNNVYDILMQYVKEGGVLLVQYNTNNFISNVRSKIGPYDFTISRNRVTDEEAKVNFLLPSHPALNWPNKITEKDFEGWIQERSIYHAEKTDSNYKHILSMKDPGETDQDGSLIIANYGKGRFIYTGLVFFRELPAGVPGAYRLFANLISNKIRKQVFKNK
jgi:LmbE family N-acetylglucosaminyl deacetylase